MFRLLFCKAYIALDTAITLETRITYEALFFVGCLDHKENLLNEGRDYPADVLGVCCTALRWFSGQSEARVQVLSKSFLEYTKQKKALRAIITITFKLSVWGCVTKEGLGPLVQIQGKLTAKEYCQILQNVSFPFLNGDQLPGKHYVFQQDRAPVHTAKKVQALLQQKVLPFSVASPITLFEYNRKCLGKNEDSAFAAISARTVLQQSIRSGTDSNGTRR
ncbi:hypothetical protein HPB48_009687 [Haemaphysalis longicornis]|uniref:Transposase n=1 Tax=Haemaphysalis longicornis TaxID=44386 RepID=A0A9J6FMY8_HAELO|nr:hypothetical protein HPB48_009687 [Haemaphysalis longicornis]